MSLIRPFRPVVKSFAIGASLGLIPPIVWEIGLLRGDYVTNGGIIDADAPFFPCAILLLASDGAGALVSNLIFAFVALLNGILYGITVALLFLVVRFLVKLLKFRNV